MKYFNYLLLGAVLLSGNMTAAEVSVYPQPRSMQLSPETVSVTCRPEIVGQDEASPIAVKSIEALFANTPEATGKTAGLRIIIGERGDKSVKKYARNIPREADGYYLKISGNTAVIAGNDERGTFYGAKTLGQLFQDGQLPEVEITDYPVALYRGVVEGFYGTPWSMKAREELMKFYGDYKMNTYIYAPKDDPYHRSPNWRDPYPAEKAAELKSLVDAANANGVDFVWAIHPGQDIKWNDEDRDLLIRKFSQLYELGVRSFAVFFDDITGEGTDPVRQAKLLNYIDDNFIKSKPDIKPFLMCPTVYTGSWGKQNDYLKTMGDMLNPDINIMYTGEEVIVSITRETIDWVNSQIKRPVYIWWNFPVTDYVRNRLLLGSAYGNDTTLTSEDIVGFLSNPMEHSEASKIAIYSIADYSWNPATFNSEKSWKDAIAMLMPSDADALECFASNNSDPGTGWFNWRRDESVEIKPYAERYADAVRKGEKPGAEDAARLKCEFEKIVSSSDRLLANTENEALMKEIGTWVRQFKLQGETGRELLAMADAYYNADTARFVAEYKHVRALQRQSFVLDQTNNQNEYHPGILVGTRVIQPFINEVFSSITKSFNAKYGTSLEIMSEYSPHKFQTTIEQLKGAPVRIKGENIQLPPQLEVIRWGAGQYVQVDLAEETFVVKAQINLGNTKPEIWKFEILADNGEWVVLPLTNENGDLTATIDRNIKGARLTNASGDNLEVFLRRWDLVFKK